MSTLTLYSSYVDTSSYTTKSSGFIDPAQRVLERVRKFVGRLFCCVRPEVTEVEYLERDEMPHWTHWVPVNTVVQPSGYEANQAVLDEFPLPGQVPTWIYFIIHNIDEE